MNEQDRNPFRAPKEIDSGKRTFSFVYLFACLLWCGLAIKMMVIRPIMLSFFEEFGIELPALTRWLLNPAQIVFFVVIAVATISAGLIVKTAEGRRRLGWRALALALFTILVLMIGVGLPFLKVIQALS